MKQALTHQLRALLQALQFLTTLPAPATQYSPRSQAASLVYYPLVGLLIGLLLMLAAALLQGKPPLLASALCLAGWVLLSGGLHLDGLIDLVDGLAGAHGNPQRLLAIMKEPRVGALGVIALVLTLLLKWAALLVLLTEAPLLVLVVAPLLARASVLLLFLWLPYRSEAGIASGYSELVAPGRLLGAVLAACILTAAVLPMRPFCLVLLMIALAFACYRWFLLKHLGGFTGDGAGAWIELTELAVVVLLGLLA